MSDYDESSERAEFEFFKAFHSLTRLSERETLSALKQNMEERLDEEDSQLATSAESEEWAEGDSQTGEIEALEGVETEDGDEWAREDSKLVEDMDLWPQQDRKAADRAELETDQLIYEALTQDREDTRHMDAFQSGSRSQVDDHNYEMEGEERLSDEEVGDDSTEEDWREATDIEDDAGMEDEEEEWLMDEVLSEDDGPLSQNGTEVQNILKPESPKETVQPSSAQQNEELDLDDNDSTEDLLLLLGGDTKRAVTTKLQAERPPKQESEDHSAKKEHETPWQLEYTNDAKKKLVQTSTTCSQIKLPSTQILPREENLTDVKKNVKLPNFIVRPAVKQQIVNQIGSTIIKSVKQEPVVPVTDVKKGATAVKVGLRDIRISDIKKRPRENDDQEQKPKLQKSSIIITPLRTNRKRHVDVSNVSSANKKQKTSSSESRTDIRAGNYTDNRAENLTDKSAENSTDNRVENRMGKQAETRAAKRAENRTNNRAENSTDNHVENPMDKQAETRPDKLAEKRAVKRVGNRTNKRAENRADNSAENSADRRAGNRKANRAEIHTNKRAENHTDSADKRNDSQGKKGLISKKSKPGDGTDSGEFTTSDESDRELRQLIRDNEGSMKLPMRSDNEENTSSDDGDSDDMLDSMSSSDDEPGVEYEFTLDLRGERASEFLPLLGRDALSLLTLQRDTLVSTLETLRKERAGVRDKMRTSTDELRQLNLQLTDLNKQLGV